MTPKSSWREECGVVGVVGHPRASQLAYLGLYALQHRGQEAAGIASFDRGQLHDHRQLGLVNDVFTREVLDGLIGDSAIGHNRYSTTGSTVLPNVQPLLAKLRGRIVALAHNGNLVNARMVREELEAGGSIFQTSMDSEIILHLMARSRHEEVPRALRDGLDRVHGAYSMLLLDGDELYAGKDPHGIRPLCIGRLADEGWIVASESCALDIVGARFEREVEPGELVRLRAGEEPEHLDSSADTAPARCVFESIYFSRPDSRIWGRSAGEARVDLGRRLAQEMPAPGGEVVISVPDSSNAAALGFSMESGIPYGFGLIRNHYVGRTFIDPSPDIRDFSARVKYNAVDEVVRGRSVVVVDDSIVRGTTVRKLVRMLRAAGAKEVHFRVSSAPIVSPCFYGIDTPTEEELVASSRSANEIGRLVGADTLGYLSIEGMLESVGGGDGSGFCSACFDRSYPIAILERPDKTVLESGPRS